MSQHDMDIANASGAAFRADLNVALGALTTMQSGAAAPSPTFPNQLWFDTTVGFIKKRNNGNTAWVLYGGSGQYSPTLTGTANVAASTTALCNYTINNGMVAVYGSFAVDPTTITTITTIEVSLPIASNLAAITDLNGTAVSPVSGAPETWSVVGSVANDRAVFLSVVTTAANHVIYFSFMYQIL